MTLPLDNNMYCLYVISMPLYCVYIVVLFVFTYPSWGLWEIKSFKFHQKCIQSMQFVCSNKTSVALMAFIHLTIQIKQA